MNKKVLIFGLGFQGKKYVNYFKNKGFIIDGVTKSGLNKRGIKGINRIFEPNYIFYGENNFFDSYDAIIIAVDPVINQTHIIEYLLKSKVRIKIIIEKPVTHNRDLFLLLTKKKNISFFLDEIYFSRFFINKDISNININILKDEEFILHSIGFFLLNKTFASIITNIDYNYINGNSTEKLLYTIRVGNYEILFNGKDYLINNKKIGDNIFDLSLDYLLNDLIDDEESNYLYKKNMYLFSIS